MSFGAGAGGAFGFGQQQQGQQQAGQTGAFGAAQPGQAGFGFGAQQPQQQAQQPGVGGGLFGASSQTTPFTFGAANNTAANGGGLFGAQQNKPATTGFGGFGTTGAGTTGGMFNFGAGATGGTSMQPAQQQNTGLFGASNTGSGAFGAKPAGTGLFGAQTQQPSSFGQQSTGLFGAMGAGPTAMPTQGSSNPPYQPHVIAEKDNNNSTTNFSYQSITCLPAYRNVSFEELRVQDYQQGRKTGTAGPGAGTLGFGQQGTQGTGTFGQPATGGLFGQTNQQGNTGNLFGQPQQQQQTGGLFGQQNQAAGGAFGQNTAQQQSGGIFGQNKPIGLFGQAAQPTATGGLFGQQPQQQANSAFSFGSTQPATNATGGGFSFGAANNNNQAKPGGLFGQSGTSSTFGGFGQTPQQGQTTNAFGQQNPATTTGGFGFGPANNAAKPGGLFGGAASTTAPATGFGVLGSSTAATNQAKPAFSFGSTTSNTAAPSTFGTNTAGAQPATGGGLFGANASAPTAFNTANAAAPAAGGGLFGGGAFGSKPAGTGLFGTAGGATAQQPTTGVGLFGNTQTNAGGNMFGAKPATSQPGGLFGGFGAQQSTAAGTGNTFGGGGLFGANAQAKPGGLFGNGSTGGGHFGNNAQAGATGSTGGLFGASTGTGLFGNSNAAGPQGSNSVGTGLFGSTTGAATGFGQSLNLGQQNLTQSQILAQSVAQGLAKGIDADPYGTESLFRSTGLNGGSSLGALGLGQSTLGSNLGNQPLLPFNLANKDHRPRFGLGASCTSVRDSPFRSSPRSSAKTLRYRSATPSLGLFANTNSVGAGTFRDSTPGIGREGSIGPGSPASLRTGGSSIFRALGSDSTLPSQAFTSRPSVKRLVLTDGSAASVIAGSPAASRAGSANPFNSPSVRRSGTVPPTRNVNFSPAYELSASQHRAHQNIGADSDISLSLDQRLNASEDSPVKVATGTTRSLFGDNSVGAAAETRSAARDKDGDSLTSDYKLSPTLSELRRMTRDELKTVRDFTVSRPGYGSVRFLPPVDLSGIPDLASIAGGIVQIRSKECYVYPERDACVPGTDGLKPGYVPGPKAPQGEALNVPAIVSLDKCWPVDRATREPIKDPEHPRFKQHVAKLKKKADTKFIDFHAQTGAWQFQVEHFSRYGLDSEDEDAEEPAARPDTAAPAPYKPKLKPMTSHTPAATKHLDDAGDDSPPAMALIDDRSDASLSSKISTDLVDDSVPRSRTRQYEEPASGANTPQRSDIHSWAVTRGIQAEKVQIMQASLFGSGQASAKDPRLGPRTPSKTHQPSRKHPRASSTQPETPSLTSGLPAAGRPDFATLKASATLSNSSHRVRKFTRTNINHSLSKGQDSLRIDAGLSLGRSFRVGWGPGGLLAHNGALTGMALSSSLVPSLGQKRTSEEIATTVRLQKILNNPNSYRDKLLDPVMEIQLEHTNIQVQAEGPVAKISPSARFHHFAALFDLGEHSEEAHLWRLGHALFDEIDLELHNLDHRLDVPEELRRQVAQLKRKEALSNWLEQAVQHVVEAESRSHVAMGRTPDTLFTYLSGHQLQRACLAAFDAGDVHLSTLIAQAPGDDECRDDLEQQLQSWRRQGVDAHITKQTLRLYELLSGNVNRAEVNNAGARDAAEVVEAIDIAAGLDWKRAFGLHLWYGVPYEAQLSDSLDSYDRAVHQLRTAAPPFPAYRAKAHIGELRLRELIKTRSYDRDALFELIKLLIDPSHDLETALGPCNFSPRQTDYRLPWHLYMLLSGALKVRDFKDRIDVLSGTEEAQHYSARADALTADFANQLELNGQWTAAVFVLLHLQLATSRQRAVKDVLTRCIQDATEAEIDFITQELFVPVAWVSEARAVARRCEDDRYGQYLYLCEAGQLTQAHELATTILLPEAIIRTDHRAILRILGFLSRCGGNRLPEWNVGGKLFLDYVACVWNLPSLEHYVPYGFAEDDEAFLMRMQELVEMVDKIQGGLPSLLPLSKQAAVSSLDTDPSLAQIQATQQAAREHMMSILSQIRRRLLKVLPASRMGGPGWDTDFAPSVETVQTLAHDHFDDLFCS